MSEFAQLISTVGFPIALILMIGAALWRMLVWSAPRVDAWINAHVSLVQRLERSIEKFECRFEPPPEKPDRGCHDFMEKR